MRRIRAALLALLLLVSMTVPVAAATAAQSVKSNANVSSDGTCQVTLNLTLHFDTPVDSVYFPVPKKAQNITLNGSHARTKRSGDVLLVNLSKVAGIVAGNYTLSIGYTLKNTVSRNELDQLVFTLPIVEGFEYPVEALEFTVVLPGAATASPTFTSSYLQSTVESVINLNSSGDTISGSLSKPLKDKEGLYMSLLVTEEMFPQDPVFEFTSGLDNTLMWAFAGIAVAYFFLFLRCLPPRRIRSTCAPEGYTAGHMGCGLTGQGIDLNMLVFSWAQMGYILIHLDRHGRVILHKRMEMGNERSAFEAQTFRTLFGKRRMVDGTGYQYAQLYRKMLTKNPKARELFRRRSGNQRILRVLCTLSGFFCAMSLGRAIAGDALLAGLVTALIAVVGGAAAWLVLRFPRGLHLRERDILYIALAAIAVWLLLGAAAGNIQTALYMVLFLLVMALAAAYGGRRTATGKQVMGQILGLFRYFLTVSREDLRRISKRSPEYFFQMAPWALALGLDRVFARKFGGSRLRACPYLTTGMDAHMTALEWSKLMRQAVSLLDAKQKRLPYQRLFGK